MRTPSANRPAPGVSHGAARTTDRRARNLGHTPLLAALGVIALSALAGLAVGAARSERQVATVDIIVAGLRDPRSFDPAAALRDSGVELAGLQVGEARVDDATRLVTFTIEASAAERAEAWALVDDAAGRYVTVVHHASTAASANGLVRTVNTLSIQLAEAQAELVAVEAAWRAQLQTIPLAARLEQPSPAVDAKRDEVERITAELSAMRSRSDARTVDADQPVAELRGPVATHTEPVGLSPWRGAIVAASAAAVVTGLSIGAMNALQHSSGAPRAGERRARPSRNQIGTSHP